MNTLYSVWLIALLASLVHATDYVCLLGPDEVTGLYETLVTDLSESTACNANDDCLCAPLTSKC